jgi:hypothetical protein
LAVLTRGLLAGGLMLESAEVVIAGSGEADAPQMELFSSIARSTVRYADPAAWITATAVSRAFKAAANAQNVSSHQIGLIVISDVGPGETMQNVAQAAVEGFSSPLRYPAANPGSLVGVSCIAFGFRGPTLNLTTPPADAVAVSLKIAAGWLARNVVQRVVVATYLSSSKGALARAALLAPPPPRDDDDERQRSAGAVGAAVITDWLIHDSAPSPNPISA